MPTAEPETPKLYEAALRRLAAEHEAATALARATDSPAVRKAAGIRRRACEVAARCLRADMRASATGE